MGHKSGLRHTSARGKATELARSKVEARQTGPEIDVKRMAIVHAKQSIRTLSEAQRTGVATEQR